MSPEWRFRIARNTHQNGSGVIIGEKKVYNLDKKGIICIVYDKNTSKCIDVATFLVENDFKLVHSLDKIQ